MRAVAVVVMIATTVSFVRVLIAVAVMTRQVQGLFASLVWPMAILMGLSLVPALLLWLRVRRRPTGMPIHQNPTQLRSAVVFAVVYSVVLLALAAARKYLGGQGVLAVAGISGLTDMDAITLSTARMSIDHASIAVEGWRLIVVAALANLVSKGILGGLIGGWRLLGELALLFAIPFAGGIALLWFW